jgi:adenylosuccinate synthase
MSLGKKKIGTTRRGIGPAYADKAARVGVRVQDLLDPKIFHQKVQAAMRTKADILRLVYEQNVAGLEAECDRYLAIADTLRPYIADCSLLLWEANQAGRNILFEGAQGTLLDIDHGTYPFVTSSNPVAGYAAVGSGIGPTAIDEVWGICKAYTTRVGEGPFPTELADAVGLHLRDVGHEFGTTTGRERRCGWLDLVALRYAVRVNGLTGICLTKLDVLNGLDELKVCTSYRAGDERYTELPTNQTIFHHAQPEYQSVPGWREDVSAARRLEDLPREAREYLELVESHAGVPIVLVSVGPRRDETIRLR